LSSISSPRDFSTFEYPQQILWCVRRAGPEKAPEKFKLISGAGPGRSVPTASPPVSLARAFRRVPVLYALQVSGAPGPGSDSSPLARRPRHGMAATALSLKGASSGSGSVWSPERCFIMPDTLSKHDQKLGLSWTARLQTSTVRRIRHWAD
jgi:hypothetical protein